MKILRIGIAGLGTVGQSVVAALQNDLANLQQKSKIYLQLVAVSARNINKPRNVQLDGIEWFDCPLKMAQIANIDVFVELIGGSGGIVLEAVKAALGRGCAVVTANKALLAEHGLELAMLAEQNNSPLHFEAAVAGGVPIIKLMRESFISNTVSRLYGIMNGTCNYILTEMEQGNKSFKEALADAQALGYAESNPSSDIDGWDTAHKLALLTALAFNTAPALDKIAVSGIRNISLEDIKSASELGYKIKLLGVAIKTSAGIEQRVQPIMLPNSSNLAQINGVTNAVSVQGNLFGNILICGAGAGGDATASAVLADILGIGEKYVDKSCSWTFSVPASKLQPLSIAAEQYHPGGFFLRLRVKDKAGVLVSLLGKLAEHNISLKSLVQKPDTEDDIEVKTVIIITYGANETAIKDAILKMLEENLVVSAPQLIRIEHTA